MKRLLLAFVIICTTLIPARSAQVSLLTAYPGAEIFQLEGHTALRIIDDFGRDYVVNWGVFDFNSPNFVGRFVAGQTDYLCWPFPTRYFMNDYKREGRMVIEQILDLDSLQTCRLIEAVQENLRPENREYRYNYVLDNCATRPLEMIEAATGRQLLSGSLTDKTFRSEMQRYHKDFPWYQFGIDLALGRNLDRPIRERQAAFAPVTLMSQLGETDIVKETITHGKQTLRNEPTPWYLTPMAAAVLVFILAIAACYMPRFARWFDTVLFTVQFICGCLIAFLIFVSTHEATSPNLLLLWLNPFCLLGAILPWRKRPCKWGRIYYAANLACLIIMTALCLLLGRAMNPSFWPLIAASALRSLQNLKVGR